MQAIWMQVVPKNDIVGRELFTNFIAPTDEVVLQSRALKYVDTRVHFHRNLSM